MQYAFSFEIERICHTFYFNPIHLLTIYSMTWLSIEYFTLTHFMPLVSFDTPSKHEKTKGFLMLSGGIEKYQWHEMG